MAKRIAQSSVNWSSLAERVPSTEKARFTVFKTKSDQYLRKVLSFPAEAPKIDWATYKKSVPVAGMVDTFQKQYEALKIPYPVDNFTKVVDAETQQVKAAIAKFIEASNEKIKESEKEIARINALIPYSEMTMEDFKDAHPEVALDPINRPTFWPHTAEDGHPGRIMDFMKNKPAH